MIIAFTGHRKINGEYPPSSVWAEVARATKIFLQAKKPSKCISGVALGFDQVAVLICVELGIPFVAAVPCPGQDLVWPHASRLIYAALLLKASEVVVISKAYSSQVMQRRNEYMVDNCDEVLACWDGNQGGTANCVHYARIVGRPGIILNPQGMTFRPMHWK
jgi:uncharacterized phage-like protein YoqJ